jgi:hypothetical protein
MKTKLLAVLATFGMVASASAVKINNNLSINGFIDGSYSLTESDAQGTGAKAAAGDQGTGDLDDQKLGLDEVELNFELNVGNVSGSIQIDNNNERNYLTGISNAQNTGFAADDANSTDTVASGNSGSHNDLDIEQAYFTYNINDAISVTLGRYGSALGFEREDPAGLYTFSRAYSGSFNLGNVDAAAVEGVTVAYSGDVYSIAASFEEAAGTDLEVNDLNLELAFTYTGIAGVNIGGGYFFDNAEGDETDVLNVHVSRQFGKLLLAGEYIEASTSSATAANNVDNDAYLLLADYDINDKLGFAIRFSQNEQGTAGDYEKFTIAPNYSITDSLGAIVEYSDIENDGAKSEQYAVELTFTF